MRHIDSARPHDRFRRSRSGRGACSRQRGYGSDSFRTPHFLQVRDACPRVTETGETQPLRTLCSGRLKEVARALGARTPEESTPWPDWPVSRLILEPWLATNCSSHTWAAVHDGHNFVGDGPRAGAMAAVVAQERLAEFPEPVRAKLFAVKDTLAALQELARAVRMRWGRRLAAITGSQGRLQRKKFWRRCSRAVPRTEIRGQPEQRDGLPLQLRVSNDSDEAAGWKLGMSHVESCDVWRRFARPDVGVVTRSRRCIWNFSPPEEIALAKREADRRISGARERRRSECRRSAVWRASPNLHPDLS